MKTARNAILRLYLRTGGNVFLNRVKCIECLPDTAIKFHIVKNKFYISTYYLYNDDFVCMEDIDYNNNVKSFFIGTIHE